MPVGGAELELRPWEDKASPLPLCNYPRPIKN